jgi:hypothetical protein
LTRFDCLDGTGLPPALGGKDKSSERQKNAPLLADTDYLRVEDFSPSQSPLNINIRKMTAQKLSPVNSGNLELGEQTLQRQLILFQGTMTKKFVKFTPKQAAIAGRAPPKKTAC